MRLQAASRRHLFAASNLCCLVVVAFAGLVSPSSSAGAALITSEQSISSAQMLGAIEGGETQLGGLSVWYDVALSESGSFANAGSRVVDLMSSGMDAGSPVSSEEDPVFRFLPNLNSCLFTATLGDGAASGFGASGSGAGQGSSLMVAILVPQTRFPVSVLNHFWRGADFLFVPPVVPDELLRPPQI